MAVRGLDEMRLVVEMMKLINGLLQMLWLLQLFCILLAVSVQSEQR